MKTCKTGVLAETVQATIHLDRRRLVLWRATVCMRWVIAAAPSGSVVLDGRYEFNWLFFAIEGFRTWFKTGVFGLSSIEAVGSCHREKMVLTRFLYGPGRTQTYPDVTVVGTLNMKKGIISKFLGGLWIQLVLQKTPLKFSEPPS